MMIDEMSWRRMTPKERKATLQEIENRSAELDHRPAAKIMEKGFFHRGVGYHSYDHSIRVGLRGDRFDNTAFEVYQQEAAANVNAAEAVARRSSVEVSGPKIKADSNRVLGLYSGREYERSRDFDAKVFGVSVRGTRGAGRGYIEEKGSFDLLHYQFSRGVDKSNLIPKPSVSLKASLAELKADTNYVVDNKSHKLIEASLSVGSAEVKAKTDSLGLPEAKAKAKALDWKCSVGYDNARLNIGSSAGAVGVSLGELPDMVNNGKFLDVSDPKPLREISVKSEGGMKFFDDKEGLLPDVLNGGTAERESEGLHAAGDLKEIGDIRKGRSGTDVDFTEPHHIRTADERNELIKKADQLHEKNQVAINSHYPNWMMRSHYDKICDRNAETILQLRDSSAGLDEQARGLRAERSGLYQSQLKEGKDSSPRIREINDDLKNISKEQSDIYDRVQNLDKDNAQIDHKLNRSHWDMSKVSGKMTDDDIRDSISSARENIAFAKGHPDNDSVLGAARSNADLDMAKVALNGRIADNHTAASDDSIASKNRAYQAQLNEVHSLQDQAKEMYTNRPDGKINWKEKSSEEKKPEQTQESKPAAVNTPPAANQAQESKPATQANTPPATNQAQESKPATQVNTPPATNQAQESKPATQANTPPATNQAQESKPATVNTPPAVNQAQESKPATVNTPPATNHAQESKPAEPASTPAPQSNSNNKGMSV